MTNRHVETRTDEDIKAEVVEQFRWDQRVDASRIQVTVRDRIVTLEGSVPSQQARTSCMDDAAVIRGVLAVKNRIDVEPYPETRPPTDQELAFGIGNLFGLDSELQETDLDVQVRDGVVTMEGAVPSYWQRTRAKELAAGFSGVMDINNHLSVVPGEEHADQALAYSVNAALERNDLVDTEAITVEAHEGTVTLTGTVPTWHAYTAASRTATHTGGVRDVENRLVVYP